MSRQRAESVIMTDMEYIRPRYTLVFSMAAIFLLIVLNVTFWYGYFSVIIWAVAASQLIRPMTEEYVGLASRLLKSRAKEKRSILRLLLNEVMSTNHTNENGSPHIGNGHEKSVSNGIHQKHPRKLSVGEFVFTNSTGFLICAILFHLMPLRSFIVTAMVLILLLVVISLILDYSGLIDTLLRSLSRPEIVSSIIIFGIVSVLAFVAVSLLGASLFELADLASEFSNSVSLFVSELAQMSSSSQTIVHSFSSDFAWVQENANKVYDYSNKEFGSRRWWVVVETMRKSFERGESAETMARSGMEQLRIAYNNADWLDLVETAVMTAVPGHRKSSPEEFSISKMATSAFGQVSLTELWLKFVEIAWQFSSLSMDLLKYLSEFAGQLIVFFFILQQICRSPRDVITCVCLFTVPATNKAKRRLNDDLQKGLRNAFTDPTISAHKSALVVLIVYAVLNLPGAFISTTFVYLVSILHIFPENGSLLACSLPYISYQILRIFFHRDWSWFLSDASLWVDALRALLLPFMLINLNAYANSSRQALKAISAERTVSPWLTDFSLAVGISKCGTDGIILGPFLATVSYVVATFALDIAEQDAWWDDVMIAEAVTRSQSMMAKRNSEVSLGQLANAEHAENHSPNPPNQHFDLEHHEGPVFNSPLINRQYNSKRRDSIGSTNNNVTRNSDFEQSPASSFTAERQFAPPLIPVVTPPTSQLQTTTNPDQVIPRAPLSPSGSSASDGRKSGKRTIKV